MNKKYTQEDLNKILWDSANSSRSQLNAADYMNYVLPMLFLKYLSDKSKNTHEEYKKRFAGDEKRIEDKMKLDRFYLPPKSSFDYIYSIIEQDNLGEEINKALHRIEDHNKEKLDGVFSVDFNSE
jgi:type I restriction enzyme M protein